MKSTLNESKVQMHICIRGFLQKWSSPQILAKIDEVPQVLAGSRRVRQSQPEPPGATNACQVSTSAATR